MSRIVLIDYSITLGYNQISKWRKSDVFGSGQLEFFSFMPKGKKYRKGEWYDEKKIDSSIPQRNHDAQPCGLRQ